MEKKTTKKVIIGILIMILLVIILISIFSREKITISEINLNDQDKCKATTTVDGITWNYTLENGKATNVYYESGELGEIVEIPAYLDEYEVVSIYNTSGEDRNIFTKTSQGQNTAIKKVILPDTLEIIGNLVFESCIRLESIEIPNSVESIGNGAFISCTSLTEIEIPDSVTSIGNGAFKNCTNLESIEIGESVRSIGWRAFESCTNLESIEIPNRVTIIGAWAFYRCTSLEEVEIGNRVTRIDQSAFENCTNLESIEIPNSVTSIGRDAFRYCISLTSIEVSNENENYASIDGVLFNKDITKIIQYPGSKQGEQYIIPSSVTSIENHALWNCTSLISIEIPDSVTSIGSYAFKSCTSLISIDIPDSVTSIGDSAFENCTSLTSVEIGNSVTMIAQSAFESCTNLESIEIPNSVTSIGWRAFSKCTSLTRVEIGNSVTSIGSDAFYNCTSLISIDIPDSVTSIGDSAFENCTSLKSIEIPNSVISIGENAFESCTNLTIYTNSTYVSDYADSNNINYVLDQIEPSITVTGNISIWTKEDIYITVEDNESGISSVKVNDNVIDLENGQASFRVTQNGTYEIVAIDKVGNIAEEVIEIDKIDKDNPIINSILGNATEWTKEDVTLTVNAIDALSGIKDYSFDGGTTWQESNEKTYNNNTENIVIKVRDNAGNVVENEPISITKIIKLSRIEVKEEPERTEYIVGENFNPEGMKIEAVYDNGSKEEISNYEILNGENLQIGQTSVMIRYTENGITKEVEQPITVSEGTIEIENYEIVEEDGIKYIEKILPNTTIEMLKENIDTNGIVEVYDGENKITDEMKKIGTGMTVKIKLNNQEETYEVVVTGDLTGDGETSISDLLKLARYNAKLDKNLSGAYLRATEIVRDGNLGSISDLVKLARVLAKLDNL